jgi:hypothetical protein
MGGSPAARLPKHASREIGVAGESTAPALAGRRRGPPASRRHDRRGIVFPVFRVAAQLPGEACAVGWFNALRCSTASLVSPACGLHFQGPAQRASRSKYGYGAEVPKLERAMRKVKPGLLRGGLRLRINARPRSRSGPLGHQRARARWLSEQCARAPLAGEVQSKMIRTTSRHQHLLGRRADGIGHGAARHRRQFRAVGRAVVEAGVLIGGPSATQATTQRASHRIDARRPVLSMRLGIAWSCFASHTVKGFPFCGARPCGLAGQAGPAPRSI